MADPAAKSEVRVPIGALVLAGGMLGALLLLIAEFTTLYEVHTAAATGAIKSVQTGSNHAYAMLVIALVAGAFAFGAFRYGSRPALLAVGVLGLMALIISLFGDLPDAHRSGLINVSGHYVLANSSASAGLYMETLGAALLLITSVSGFILLGPPRPARAASGGSGRDAAPPAAGVEGRPGSPGAPGGQEPPRTQVPPAATDRPPAPPRSAAPDRPAAPATSGAPAPSGAPDRPAPAGPAAPHRLGAPATSGAQPPPGQAPRGRKRRPVRPKLVSTLTGWWSGRASRPGRR